MKSTFIRLGAASTVLAALALTACGGGGGSPGINRTNGTTGNGSGTPPALGGTSGTLSVSLTDAPACGFDAVNVTVSKVRVHQSASAADADTGWSEVVLAPARKINLLNLTNGKLDALGSTEVPSGHYSQVRLVLDPNTGAGMANTVTPTGTKVETSLETPAAIQSGIRVVGEFDVVAGQNNGLVLDFDACRSVVNKAAGGYLLTPVISVVPSIANGINGYVSPAAARDGVVVSAQQNGSVVGSTVADPATGAFSLSRLNPGAYDIVFVGAGHAAAVIGAVPVASTTGTIAVSTAAAPINLPASLSRTISGTVTQSPASTTVRPYVKVLQTIAAGKSVVIQAGDAGAGGAYSITGLPVAAPQYANYGASLPLTFGPVVPVQGVGGYRVDALATGYVFKTVSVVDVAAGDKADVNLQLTQ
ncbi:DUF4382 domain-containing protein [Massilia antarctica]|uniref:DUF4382 domain-containing protein n=1 Tax=Massilia antarctica TaxID=2765360 RepID=UPI0006BB55CA|nr:DUF4382 domain-containing protein [Massilia sp. H27-R4]MCY0912868.1 DUF4382 domain-containing protein [Massilia sp. H27-R4]CUI07442.1 Probable lipoprotein [Janthinobacterium sp. CG23_2]CUU31228.1 Probable lipoprotein [Janthinobacterium sp. CG23_2]